MKADISQFAAVVGLDWADRKHDVCLFPHGSDENEPGIIEHDPVAIAAWAEDLRKRFSGRPIAVCVELTRGPIVSALLEHDIFVVFPVNPSSLAKYRRALHPSRAKDDPTDAFLAADFFRRHTDQFAPLSREHPAMRALQRLVRGSPCTRAGSRPNHEPNHSCSQSVLPAGLAAVS